SGARPRTPASAIEPRLSHRQSGRFDVSNAPTCRTTRLKFSNRWTPTRASGKPPWRQQRASSPPERRAEPVEWKVIEGGDETRTAGGDGLRLGSRVRLPGRTPRYTARPCPKAGGMNPL